MQISSHRPGRALSKYKPLDEEVKGIELLRQLYNAQLTQIIRASESFLLIVCMANGHRPYVPGTIDRER